MKHPDPEYTLDSIRHKALGISESILGQINQHDPPSWAVVDSQRLAREIVAEVEAYENRLRNRPKQTARRAVQLAKTSVLVLLNRVRQTIWRPARDHTATVTDGQITIVRYTTHPRLSALTHTKTLLALPERLTRSPGFHQRILAATYLHPPNPGVEWRQAEKDMLARIQQIADNWKPRTSTPTKPQPPS